MRIIHKIVIDDTTLKELDSEGKFESDDEIGVVFEGIKNTIKDLSTINNKDIYVKEKKRFTKILLSSRNRTILRHNKETRPIIRERIYNEHIRSHLKNCILKI